MCFERVAVHTGDALLVPVGRRYDRLLREAGALCDLWCEPCAMSMQCCTTPPRCVPPPPMPSAVMPRKSRPPVGSYWLALVMSSASGSSHTLRQRSCARSRSA
eukprot:1360854-Prymnesium_polylepis.1